MTPHPKTLSIEAVREALKSARFNELLGAVETENLDFKDQPYQLNTDKQKFDLLQDIASFANHQGGLLVLGCHTTRANVEGDIVDAIRPIPRQMLDFETYRSLINAHIHPVPKGIEFWYFPTADDQSVGLALIEIQAASPADAPHLIAHIVTSDTEKKFTTRYALVTRTGARNNPYPVESIHGLIQIGKSVGGVSDAIQKIEARLSSIESSLSRRANEKHQITLAENRKTFLEILPALLKESGFEDSPAFVMAAFPSEPVELRGIYDSESGVSKEFDHPLQLRESGFDLSIGRYGGADIVDGNRRRKMAPGYKAVNLSISGRLIAIVPATEDFLAWAMKRKPGAGIMYRSFVLTEVTYIFADLLKKIFDAAPMRPREFDLMAGLRNSFVDGQPPRLGTSRDHGPWTWNFNEPLLGPKPNILKTIRVSSDMPVGRLAFEIRAALYHRFGYTDEVIPYTSVTNEGRVTNPEEILSPNQQ